MNGYFSASAVFLIETIFGLYMLTVLLRFILQWVRADFHNPISQFLVKVTNPPLKPLRLIIPGIGGLDLAAIVLLLALQAIKLMLLATTGGFSLAPAGLIVMSVGELIALVLNMYLITIIIQAIISWVGPGTYNPVTAILHYVNEPVLAPARRIMPAISGIDLSPLLVLIVIQLLKFLLVAPILDVGRAMA